MTRVSFGLLATTAGICITLAGVTSGAQAPKGNPEARKLKNPVASNAASISAGQAVYKKQCAYCHNEDGKGDGPLAPKDSHPPDLTDNKWDHGSSDGEIFTIVKDGPPKDAAGKDSVMKPFGKKLMDQDIWNVVNYVRSLAKNNP
jgi:mono/diheme cytochrome c family protein